MTLRIFPNLDTRLCLPAIFLLLTSCGLFTDDDARVARANAALTAGEHRAAIIDLKTVLRDDPEHAQARLLLGRALLVTGDIQGAEKELERALEFGVPLDQARVSLARVKALLGKPDEALALADIDSVGTDSERYQLWMTRGFAYVLLGQPAAGLESFAAADALGIDPVMPLIASAQVHAESDQFVESEGLLQEALKRAPDSPNALYAMAALSIRRDEPATGEKILTRALEQASLTDGERSVFLELLIEVNIVQADLEGAERLMPQLAALRPALDPALRLLRGRLELARLDYLAAIDTLSSLVRDNPNDVRAQLLLGAAYLARNQLGLADTFIRSVVHVVPDNPEANVLLSELRSRQQVSSEPANLGIQSDDIGATEADLSRRANILLGISQSNGRAEIDIASLDDWVSDYPDDAAMRALLANASLGAGRYEDARQHFEMLVRKFPDQPMLLNNLAWVYNELDDPRAADTAARANELMPDNANILDTLGWIHVNTGKPGEALAPLERAYVLSGELPIIGYHLAYAQLASGDTEAARILVGRLLDRASTPAALRAEIEALAEQLSHGQ
jgi:tetratricopeptide (TPR) repeat protein